VFHKILLWVQPCNQGFKAPLPLRNPLHPKGLLSICKAHAKCRPATNVRARSKPKDERRGEREARRIVRALTPPRPTLQENCSAAALV